MADNSKLLNEICGKVKDIIPITDDSEEARLLQKLVNQVKGDIEYIEKKLEMIGESIAELQKEVSKLRY